MSEAAQEKWTVLRRQWFGSVYEIADIELQRRSWLAPPVPSPHWSYVEFCCAVPDSEQLQDALRQGGLSQTEYDLLMSLNTAIMAHEPPNGDEYDHSAILADTAWLAVAGKAEVIRNELLLLVKDPIERGHLLGDRSTR